MIYYLSTMSAGSRKYTFLAIYEQAIYLEFRHSIVRIVCTVEFIDSDTFVDDVTFFGMPFIGIVFFIPF